MKRGCSELIRMNLLYELKRRNVLRVGAAYIVTAWLIIQVVETILPAFGFSDSVIRYATIGAAIGFLPVLVLAWVFELTPDGLKRDAEVDRSESIAPRTGRTLDRIIMVGLAVALAYFGFDKFVINPARDAERTAELAEKIDQARTAGRNQALIESFGDKSIAVLPFVNMSSDPDQEYFSDGISEELLNLLAKIPELRVISRSSAFAFKDQDITIVELAEKLNVGHVLEGSVRKAGDRIRITAQLIEARTDSHLWSETYDRTMGDVFGIQDEIASMVVDQLRIELLGDGLRSAAADPQAYELFLQGRHLAHRGSEQSVEEAISLFQQAVAIDPDYVAAWDALAVAYDNQVAMGLRPMREGAELARAATMRALEIDPDFAQSHAELGWIATSYDNNLQAAARHYEQALRLDPDNIYILAGAAVLLKTIGRVSEALALEQYIVSRDPLNPAIRINTGVSYLHLGQTEQAIQSWRSALRLSPDHIAVHYFIALALLQDGEAATALAELEQESFEGIAISGRVMSLHALGRVEESEALLRTLLNDWSEQLPVIVARVLVNIGDEDAALDLLESAVGAGLGSRIDPIDRGLEPLHDQPRWKALLQAIGKTREQLESIEFEVPEQFSADRTQV